MGGGCCLDTLLVVSLMAAEVSEARSKRPATGLATVLTTPLARPVKNPYRELNVHCTESLLHRTCQFITKCKEEPVTTITILS